MQLKLLGGKKRKEGSENLTPTREAQQKQRKTMGLSVKERGK